MIVRVFRARIRPGREAEFKRMVREQSIPWLEETEGLLGYYSGEPFPDSTREFVMVTIWRDLEALKAFAGETWSAPIVTEDEAPLVEEMFAHHYARFDQYPASRPQAGTGLIEPTGPEGDRGARQASRATPLETREDT